MKPSYTACHRMAVTTIYFPFDYQTQNCRFNQHPGDEVFPEVINNVNNPLHFSLPAHHSKRLCGSLQGNILWSLALFGPLRSTWFEPYSSYLPTFSMKCKPCPSCFPPTTFHLTYCGISSPSPHWAISASINASLLYDDPLFGNPLRWKNQSLFQHFPHFQNQDLLSSPSLTRIGDDRNVVAEILDSRCLPALQWWNQCCCPVSWDKLISLARNSSFWVQDKQSALCLRTCLQVTQTLIVPQYFATRVLVRLSTLF